MSAVSRDTRAAAAGNARARLCVISDELDDDIDVALDLCEGFAVRQVELRTVGGKNCLLVERHELTAVVRHIRERGFGVPALATPVFKCALPGAPSKGGGALHGGPVDTGLDDHFALLEEAIERATATGIPFVRIFTCWRTPDPLENLDAVVDLVADARSRVGDRPVELLVENEHDCIVATAHETRALLERSPGLRVIWDPANHVRGGGSPEESVPRGWVDRIAHLHVKDVDAAGRWVGLGQGIVPFAAMWRNMSGSGYDGAVSLETHCELNGSRVEAARAAFDVIMVVMGDTP